MLTTISPLEVFNLISSFLGITLCIFLLFIKSYHSKANVFLALTLFIWLTIILPGFFIQIGIIDYFPHITKFVFYFDFIIGPLMYFYIRSCTEKNFTWKPVYFLHFALFFLETLYNIPLMMIGGEESMKMYWEYLNTGKSPHSLLIPLLNMLHLVAYFIYAFKLVLDYRKYAINTSSTVDLAYHRWLLAFCLFNIFPILVFLILSISGYDHFPKLFTVLCIFSLMFFIYMTALFKPAIFHRFPHLKPILDKDEITRQKYESSNLTEARKENYLMHLQQQMQSEHYYKDPELTIQQLSEKIDIPVTYLSQIINEKTNCTFFDFINQYRVEKAKELLHDADYEHYTIVAIAYEAGFNSKSAFYSSFKRFTDTTPAKFRKSLIIS